MASTNPTAEDRKKTGFKKGAAKGKFPMQSEQACINAVKLRNHGKGVSGAAVLAKAAAAASKNGWNR